MKRFGFLFCLGWLGCDASFLSLDQEQAARDVKAACLEPVVFGDTDLEMIIREEIAKNEGAICEMDLQSISELHLYGVPIYQVSDLPLFKNLSKLELRVMPSMDLSPLRDLTKLEVLHLFGRNVQSAQVISSMTGLQELSLAELPDSQFGCLLDPKPLEKLSQIKKLDLSDNWIEMEQLCSLLLALPNLEELSIAGVYQGTDLTMKLASDDDLQKIAQTASGNLKKLLIGTHRNLTYDFDGKITKAGLEHLKKMPNQFQFLGLINLNRSQNGMTSEMLEALTQAGANGENNAFQHLETLEFLDAISAKMVSHANISQLKSLRLRKMPKEPGESSPYQFLQTSQLEELMIESSYVGDDHPFFSALPNTLRRLAFADITLGSSPTESSTLSNASLRVFFETRIDLLRKLQSLKLADTHMDDDLWVSINVADLLPNLESLGLYSNRNLRGSFLASLKGLNKLKVLDLTGCVEDLFKNEDNFSRLIDLVRGESFETLHIAFNTLSHEQRVRLKQARPKLKILFSQI